MGWILLVLAIIALVIVHQGRIADARRAKKAADEAKRAADAAAQRFQQQIEALNRELLSLRPFGSVRDAMAATAVLREEGRCILAEAAKDANAMRAAARAEADQVRSEAMAAANALKFDAKTSHADAQAKMAGLIESANKRAETLIADAEARALEIAGDAYRAVKEADQLKHVALAMGNVIEGCGDRYLVPTYSLLDQLGEAYGFDEAGRELTAAREISRNLVASGRAADCDYAEASRRETALRFVLDAFNGKADTVLARAKSDNVGTLEQQMKDAFSLVNHNGAAFRNARITPEYLASRLKALKWAVSIQALKEREKEEQRRIREQIVRKKKPSERLNAPSRSQLRRKIYCRRPFRKCRPKSPKRAMSSEPYTRLGCSNCKESWRKRRPRISARFRWRSRRRRGMSTSFQTSVLSVKTS